MSEAWREYIERMSIPEPNSGCWLWLGSWMGGNPKKPYGCAAFQNVKGRAHRFSYKHLKGDIPDGLQVLHKCDNRMCVNPDHLFLGTHTENMQDMIKKGRQNVQIKVGAEIVHTIRALKKMTNLTHEQIGKRVGMGKYSVGHFVRGKYGKSVPHIDYEEYYRQNICGGGNYAGSVSSTKPIARLVSLIR